MEFSQWYMDRKMIHFKKIYKEKQWLCAPFAKCKEIIIILYTEIQRVGYKIITNYFLNLNCKIL